MMTLRKLTIGLSLLAVGLGGCVTESVEPERAPVESPLPVRPWTSPRYLHEVAILFERSSEGASETPILVSGARVSLSLDDMEIRYQFGKFIFGDRVEEIPANTRMRVYRPPAERELWTWSLGDFELRWTGDGRTYPIELRDANGARRWCIGATDVHLLPGAVQLTTASATHRFALPVRLQLGPDGELLSPSGGQP